MSSESVHTEREKYNMSEENKREAIAHALRDHIKSGEFGSSGRLPSVARLAKENQTTRTTVYDAINLLLREGIVIKRDNSFYTHQETLEVETKRVPPFEQVLGERGSKAFVKNVIVPEIITMPNTVAETFEQPPDLRVVHRYRVQGKDSTPYRLSEYWFPAELASRYLKDLTENPGFDVIEFIKNDLGGIQTQEVKDIVGARLPSEEEADLLEITLETPVLEIHRTNKTLDGRVIMHHRILWTGSLITMKYTYPLESRK